MTTGRRRTRRFKSSRAGLAWVRDFVEPSARMPEISTSARRIRQHRAAGLDVYAFFNDDVEGHAIRIAMTLRQYVEDRQPSPSPG